MKKRVTAKEIKKANIEYHAKLADSYNREQPYFRPENVSRVDKILRNLAKETGGGSLLDVGCGTGFIINIASKYFDRVVGIDITPAMLEKVKQFKNVEVYSMDLFSATFKEKFDVCTTYGVLHHLFRLKTAFKKIHQFLKKDGCFYADQEPNSYYLDMIKSKKISLNFPETILKELKSVKEVDSELKNKYDLDKKITRLAEYHKLTKKNVFKEEKITELLKSTGFSSVEFKYQWFLGQGHLKNRFSQEQLADIEKYLETILPLSRNLFKYMSFVAKK